MDSEVRELVLALCTRAGATMEDASAMAVLNARLDEKEVREMIAQVRSAVTLASSLIIAADELSKKTSAD